MVKLFHPHSIYLKRPVSLQLGAQNHGLVRYGQNRLDHYKMVAFLNYSENI